jgi:hypothetical protein
MHTSRSYRRPAFGPREIVAITVLFVITAATLLYFFAQPHHPQRKMSTLAQLMVLETGLEMFNADASIGGSYPDSRFRQDPIVDFPGGTSENQLSGAHWLARSMLGPNSRGLGKTARSLGPPSDPPLKMADLDEREPHGPYIEPGKFPIAADNATRLSHGGDFVPTGRPVLLDSYGYPILYYRAYPRSPTPFSQRRTTQPAPDGEPLGIYNQEDNARITGSDLHAGWSLTGKSKTSPVHPLAVLGSNDPAHADDGTGPDGHYSFSSYLHNRELPPRQFVRTVNEETFILISAGNDGLYGTADDPTNFRLPSEQSAWKK